MEFVDVISHFVEKFLPEDVHSSLMFDFQHGMELKDILNRITLSNLSKVPLSEKDVLQLLEKMCFCNVAEEVTGVAAIQYSNEQAKGERLWKLKAHMNTFDSISATPCGKCPLFYRCFCNATVNPNRCPYINQWYDLGE